MKRNPESGMALMSTLMVMMLMSALLIGFYAVIAADQQASGVNRDQTQAYAAAHAGLEKLTADLGAMFTGGNFSPSASQVSALTTDPPPLPGFQFVGPGGTPGYTITPQPVVVRQIENGPLQGLTGLVTPYEITVTAQANNGGVLGGAAEVRMRREVQTVAVPVFQFGIFSENNLSFHANDFAFGGRVHGNQNIFIAGVQSTTLTLADRVSAVGEIIRTHFANGKSTSAANYTGTIRMAKTTGCPAAPAAANSACRNLALNEGSLTGNVGSSPNPNWTNISVGLYNGYIKNGLTGAQRLDLPLVSDDASAVDIIRRPNPASPDPASLAGQRFYNMASLRILLSDTAAELTALPDTVGTPVSLELAALPAAAGSWPLASSTGSATNGYRSAAGTPLLGGFILINKQDTGGNWSDVTNEILALGITGRNILWTGSTPAKVCASEPQTDAIIRLQRVKDAPATSAPCGSVATSAPATDYWPMSLYDPREGLRRENSGITGDTTMYLGGVMHLVEFDVNNYRRWIAGLIGTTGSTSQNVTGYAVYFSDRRTNKNAANVETGELGWEDFINTDSSSTPNGALNTGEDVNGDTVLQTYGNTPRITWTTVAPNGVAPYGSVSPIDATVNIYSSRVNYGVARANRAVFFRRALKLVNGGLGQLPSNGLQGLTVASENPVYVHGNYNACGLPTASCASGGFGATGDSHRSAAIIADAVNLLSRSWDDYWSFITPHDPNQTTAKRRLAATTWYRMGVIAGKGLNFPFPTNYTSSDAANFGSDGGAHNFMRFLEDWSTSATFNYRGSMVSLFTSRQATGTWKCCINVYTPPGRSVAFDEEFVTPTLLPPRTPMFRDINTLTFRQMLRPTQ